MRFIFVILLLSLLKLDGHAQNSMFSSYARSIDAQYKLGFLIAHRESMAHLLTSHFHTYTLSYTFHTRGYQGWEQAYNNPKVGIFATTTQNANKDVLGDAYGIGATLTLPKRSWGKSDAWSWNNNISLGMGYLTKKFDLDENPKNVAIGTHFNALIILGTEIEFRQLNYTLNFGVDFTHYSNSGTVKPNLGLNIPSLRAGISWMTKKALYNEQVVDHLREDLTLNIIAIGGAKNNYEFHKNVFPAFGLNVHLSKAHFNRNRYTYGIDVLFSEANRQFLASSPNQSFRQTLQVGVYNAWEIEIWRAVLSVGMGAYFYNPLNPHGWFFHRIGARCSISNNWFLHGYARTHWAKADFFEAGLGYLISLRK